MSNKTNDELYEEREIWLDNLGRTKGDIMDKGDGKYVMVDGEDGFEKIYLPDNFQELE